MFIHREFLWSKGIQTGSNPLGIGHICNLIEVGGDDNGTVALFKSNNCLTEASGCRVNEELRTTHLYPFHAWVFQLNEPARIDYGLNET